MKGTGLLAGSLMVSSTPSNSCFQCLASPGFCTMCVDPGASHTLPVRLRGPVIYHVSFSPGTLVTSVCRHGRHGFASSKVKCSLLFGMIWGVTLLSSTDNHSSPSVLMEPKCKAKVYVFGYSCDLFSRSVPLKEIDFFSVLAGNFYMR